MLLYIFFTDRVLLKDLSHVQSVSPRKLFTSRQVLKLIPVKIFINKVFKKKRTNILIFFVFIPFIVVKKPELNRLFDPLNDVDSDFLMSCNLDADGGLSELDNRRSEVYKSNTEQALTINAKRLKTPTANVNVSVKVVV